jgi:diguanylate cyclase (GGDEF)-like protein
MSGHATVSTRRRSSARTAFASIPTNTRVLLFAALLLGLGLALIAITPSVSSTSTRAWTPSFLALVIAFVITEGTALHVEIRKESHSLSLGAIPLMLGLLYLSPLEVIGAYVLGGGVALLFIRKSPPLKVLWNCCLLVAETALAALIVKGLLGDELPSNAAEWLIPFGAVMAAELMSLVAVPLVIMTVDTKFRPRLFAAVGRSQLLATLGGAFTVVVLAASATDPYMMIFAVVPVVGIALLLRSTGRLSQRYDDLQQLLGFTQVLTNERGARTLDAGLAHLVEVMRARTAGLLTDDLRHQERGVRMLVDDVLTDTDPDELGPLLVAALGRHQTAQLDADDPRPEVQQLLATLGAGRVLAVRVLGEADRSGILFLADRLGMRDSFTADEVRLFGSLAETLSARLSNDYLVDELESQAQHDALTGLPNRLAFELAVTASLADPKQTGAIVMIDLDRFKEINDSLGHETGDQLLIDVAQRLGRVTRTTDMVARFGGDEFALLLSSHGDETDLSRRIDEVYELVTASYELRGITFEIGASLGAVAWPRQGRESAALLRRADTAMYEAKRNQLGVLWYTPELDADAPRRLDLYLSARSALDNEELYIHLQPKVSTQTGEVTGAEALVRWMHPIYGLVPPDEFVPLIEHAGLIGQLTRFVLERAAQTATTLRSAGIDLPIAVNLTPRDLLDASLPDDIANILERHDLDASALQVEITEYAMIVDFDMSVRVLARLRELGLRASIDDFGTGYSSLQHLHRLPVDELKIDRSFVQRLTSDDRAAAIVQASVGLGRNLGLRVVAEGVEDAESFAFVSDLGCDEVQGYYFSRPLPVTEFMRWVHDGNPPKQLLRSARFRATTQAQ